MHKIAILDDFQNTSMKFGNWDSLRKHAEITIFTDHIDNEDALVERLQPYDVLCVMRERTWFPRSVLSRLKNLKMLASTGPWNAAIDIEAADELGITVCGTASSLTAAAEHTWALILAAARHIPAEVNSFRNGGWQVSVGRDLSGKTIGLLGLGYSGSVTARVAQAFGMKTIAWSQNMTAESAAMHGAQYVSKDELLASSDILSIHVRLSERTRGLIGARELSLMQPHALLVNTARGPIVDEDALIAALSRKQIAGAALDVFDIEPLPVTHAFRTMDNVIATAHLGYVTEGSYEFYYGESVENIRAWIKGEPIRTLTAARREISYQTITS
ncbi:D-2-hydroxyacid dehydrogenase family protein [Paraburkholderia hospita]|uniref:D-2-hydroxyacid dehydrogenase family protein n=1 Tax=Paraburkholderia hospita TaxID=169430 RepID=UPI00027150EA|nr:D-2-hydroxyacid dehydrogenase family protein [Paraburkholderia hospita]EUC15429.1 Phosphoglycerate dehydrogenase [Burkholderia sp. BT03]OUL97744.1 hydroxyacid dehydrogenase [Paraburkholderia hospita]SKC83145.1 Lactate dehydrogenase [Paraburkholderia hospita]